jgi:hypothetical protein
VAERPHEAEAGPATLETITLPPVDAQAGLNSNEETRAGGEAEPTDATKAEVTRPREVTQGAAAEDAPQKTDSPPDPTAAKLFSSPARPLNPTPYGAGYPGWETASPASGIFSTVNPLTAILDSNKVFVETVKNEDAHKIIVKELGKYPKLKVVATREEADFVISYTDKKGFELQPGRSTSPSGLAIPVPIDKLIGHMVVYKAGAKQDGGLDREDVLWSEPEDRDRPWWLPIFERHPATNLTRHFIKELRRLRGEIR